MADHPAPMPPPPGAPTGGTEPRSAPTGAPALVACLCAVATVMALGSYLQLRAEVGAISEELSALREARSIESGAWSAERVRGDALQKTVDELRARLDSLLAQRSNADGTEVGEAAAIAGGSRNRAGRSNRLWRQGDDPEGDAAESLPPAEVVRMPETGVDGMDASAGTVLVSSPQRQQVMIDRGRRDGWREGDAVLAYRDGRFIGDLRVAQAPFRSMAICRQTGGEALRVGDRVRLERR